MIFENMALENIPVENSGKQFFDSNDFANVISIGVDLVEIERFNSALNRTPRFKDRVFAEQELSSSSSVLSLAGKFAAKEAVLKCLEAPIFSIPFHNIKIFNKPNGAPYVQLSEKALVIAESLSIGSILVSISHSDNQAMAVACACS